MTKLNMDRKYLSKSTYIKGLQCNKALYLKKFHPEFADKISEKQEAVFKTGTDVGLLAQQLFPNGIDAGPKDYKEYFKSFKYTQQLIDNGVDVIYEAGFCYDYVMCFVDILVRSGDKWIAYEVKSSTKVSETNKKDAALQYYIMKQCGLEIEDINITSINNTYVREEELDLHQLFKSESVLSFAKSNEEEVKKELINLHKVILNNNIPNVQIGPQCNSPYKCEFQGYCWEQMPEYSIFNISGIRSNKKWQLFNDGVLYLKDIPKDFPLPDSQRFQVDSHLQNISIINKEAINGFLDNLSDTIYYLDFETYQSSVPEYIRMKAYQQIPFQYSVHIENNGKIHHHEFLAENNKDPREPFIQSLINNMGTKGDILVYNISFERGILKSLIKIYPNYKLKLQSIIDRMKDLMIPFKERWYYMPNMKGSYSIKDVLPSLLPDLTYNQLEINDGSLASIKYSSLNNTNNKSQNNDIRRDLLEYCKMDTFAMVKILEVLRKL